MILQVNVEPIWEYTKARNRHTTQKVNLRENNKQPKHPYQVGGKVLTAYKISNTIAKIYRTTQGSFQVLDILETEHEN